MQVTPKVTDLTHILPLQGKKVLSAYNWAGHLPRGQGEVSLEALHPEARSAILKEIMKVFSNYKSSQSPPQVLETHCSPVARERVKV